MKILCNTKIEKVEFSGIPFSHTIARLCNGLTLTISIPIRYYWYMDCKYYIDIDVTYSYKKFNIKNIRFCSDGKLTKPCDINEFDNYYAYILGISPIELNLMEKNFLELLEYQLFVKDNIFNTYKKALL